MNDDFSFEIKARPGKTVIRMMSVTPGWTLKAVRVNGMDVTDEGLEIRPNEDVNDIEIEMTESPERSLRSRHQCAGVKR